MWHNFDVITFHSVVRYNHNSSAHVLRSLANDGEDIAQEWDENVPIRTDFELNILWTLQQHNIYKSNKVIPIDLENLLEFMWSVITLGLRLCVWITTSLPLKLIVTDGKSKQNKRNQNKGDNTRTALIVLLSLIATKCDVVGVCLWHNEWFRHKD